MKNTKATKRKRGRLLCCTDWLGGWVDAKKTPPKEDGHYIIYAPSADADKPLVAMAWYNPASGWSLLPKCWCEAITHWMQIPKPPNTELSSERAAEPQKQKEADARRLLE